MSEQDFEQIISKIVNSVSKGLKKTELGQREIPIETISSKV